MSKLGDIMGIKPKHKAQLKKAKVSSIQALRERAATAKGRVELQSESGLPSDLIKELVNRADLLRVKGIGSEYSDLLVKTGVHNVVKLAKFEPRELHRTLAKRNSALGNRVSRLPGEGVVHSWVKQARVMASEPAGPGGGRPGGGRGKRRISRKDVEA